MENIGLNIENSLDGAVAELQEFSSDRYMVLEKSNQFFEDEDNTQQCVDICNTYLA